MFEVSKSAAKKIRNDAAQHEQEDSPLRVAVSRDEQGAFNYQMGFDDPHAEDMMIASRGVDILIAPDMKPLLNGCSLDYVRLDDGEEHFIFLNPNDPQYVPPSEE